MNGVFWHVPTARCLVWRLLPLLHLCITVEAHMAYQCDEPLRKKLIQLFN